MKEIHRLRAIRVTFTAQLAGTRKKKRKEGRGAFVLSSSSRKVNKPPQDLRVALETVGKKGRIPKISSRGKCSLQNKAIFKEKKSQKC